jgi:hypothetical protein
MPPPGITHHKPAAAIPRPWADGTIRERHDLRLALALSESAIAKPEPHRPGKRSLNGPGNGPDGPPEKTV